MFQFFQDEGPDEDFAAGIHAALGFGGSSELVELGFELGAFGLEVFESVSFLLIDSGESSLDLFAGSHDARPVGA